MPRPRTFDETAVLDAALAGFWGRGYEATSVRDLATAMGISGPSLYNAFGDKRGLFSGALEHYCRTRTYPMLARIEADHAGAAALAAFFAEIVARACADRERRGCFLINSALDVAPHDGELAQAVNGHLEIIHGFLRRQLKSARRSKEIAAGHDIRTSADHLLAVLLGIRVLSRTRPDRGLLNGIVSSALHSVGVPARHLTMLRKTARRTSTRRSVRH